MTNLCTVTFSLQHNLKFFLLFHCLGGGYIFLWVISIIHRPYHLPAFDLPDLCVSCNSKNTMSDSHHRLHRIVSHEITHPYLEEWPLLLLRPKTYSRPIFHSFRQTTPSSPPDNLIFLQNALSHVPSYFSFELSINDNVRIFTQTANTIFDI